MYALETDIHELLTGIVGLQWSKRQRGWHRRLVPSAPVQNACTAVCAIPFFQMESAGRAARREEEADQE